MRVYREEYSTSFIPSVHQTPLQSYDSALVPKVEAMDLSPGFRAQSHLPSGISEDNNPFKLKSPNGSRLVASEAPPPLQSSRQPVQAHSKHPIASGRASRKSSVSSANQEEDKAEPIPPVSYHGFSVNSASSNETYGHTYLPIQIAEDADDIATQSAISPSTIANHQHISINRERATSAPQTVAPSVLSLAPTLSRSVSPKKRLRTTRHTGMGSVSQLQSRLQLAAALSQPVLAVAMSTKLLTNLATLKGRIESIHGRIVQSSPNLLNRRLRKAFDSEGLTTLSNSLLENVENDITALNTLFQWQDEEEKLVGNALVTSIVSFLRESIKYRMVHNEVERAFVCKLQEAAKTEVDRGTPVEDSRRSPWLSLSRLGRSQNNFRSDSNSRKSSNSPSESRLPKSASVPVLNTPRSARRLSQNTTAKSQTPVVGHDEIPSASNETNVPSSPSLRYRERIIGNSKWDSEDELGRTACSIM